MSPNPLSVPYCIKPGEKRTEAGKVGWIEGGFHSNGFLSDKVTGKDEENKV